MNGNALFQIRVTGILIENEEILLVKQKVDTNRLWSLPGGRVENGETLNQAIKREMYEETGIEIKIIRLLYICEKPDVNPPILHITFLLERVSGELTLPTNEFDENPIHDVKMIPIDDLTDYGFTERFKNIVKSRFPGAGDYYGLKQNIGL